MNHNASIWFAWVQNGVVDIALLLTVVLLIWGLIYSLIRFEKKRNKAPNNPLITLQQKYTRGEITPDEYEQAYQKLINQTPDTP